MRALISIALLTLPAAAEWTRVRSLEIEVLTALCTNDGEVDDVVTSRLSVRVSVEPVPALMGAPHA